MRVRPAVSLGLVLAAAGAVALLARPGDTGDLPYFVDAGRLLLSGHWADTFADPSVQVGPVQLLAFGLGGLLADALGVSTTHLLALVVGVATAGLFWVAAGRLTSTRDPRVQLAAGLASVWIGLTYDAFVDGHPAQVIVPLLWVLAGLDARRGRAVRAGALLGLSAGLELWGLLGAAMIILSPRVRAAVASLAIQASVAVALFLPFLLAGEFRMFQYRWRVNGDTLLGLLVEPGSSFTWAMRVLQGATALGAGVALAWPLRRTLHAVWLTPLAVVAVRLALDPVRYPWYWLAFETLALLGAVEFLTSDLVRSLRTRGLEPRLRS